MKRFISILLMIVILIPSIVTSVEAADEQGIQSFVTRLYSICLDREPDQSGFNDWCNKLSNNQITGSECAYGFIFSPEFQNKNISNEQYVELMYNCFFGRASDEAGKAGWVTQMNNGMSRKQLFAGFANSTEFDNLCQEYGIMRGSYNPSTGVFSLTANKAQIEEFVTRLYSTFLGRTPDQAGLDDWVSRLSTNSITGSEAAYGFIFSQEYKAKNKTDRDFVTDLYVGFLGRNPDVAGLNSWVSLIEQGNTDLDIFNGFAGSQEWIGLCRGYGIEAGGSVSGDLYARSGSNSVAIVVTPTSTPKPTRKPTPTAKPTIAPSYTVTIERFDIIQNKYNDEYRYFAIVAVKNTGTQNIYTTSVSFAIEDSSGNLIQTDKVISCCPDAIHPGETGYLYNQFGSDLEGITDPTGLVLVPQYVIKTTDKNPHRYPISNITLRNGTYGVSALGKVTNDTETDDSYLYVQVLYYDSNNKILGISGTSITDFDASRTVSFEITAIGLPDYVNVDEIASYKLIAEETFYGF